MTPSQPFTGEPSDTRERIMRATYRSLLDSGYAGLSLQRIADESGLTKSSVYHFYDGKEDLLVSFLDFMLDNWRGEYGLDPEGNPVEQVRAYLVTAVTGSPPTTDAFTEPPGGATNPAPFVQLRAQAVTNEDYRSRFEALDAVFVDELATVIEAGIEAGTFRAVEPEPTAELLLTLLMGAVFRRPTVESFDSETLAREVDDLLDRYLLTTDQ